MEKAKFIDNYFAADRCYLRWTQWNSELSHTVNERSPCQAEAHGRTVRSANFPLRFFESLDDMIALKISERLMARRLRGASLLLPEKSGDVKGVAGGEDYCALYYIL
jgi:hypothetical protein